MRSRCADRHPVRVAHGYPLGASAGGDGLRLGYDQQAASARVASGWRVGTAASCAARPARLCQRHQLGSCGGGQRQRPGKKGGEETGPNPTDRGKPGSKRHILVDANGIPLALRIPPANRHDRKLLGALVDAAPAIRQCADRLRRRPAKLHADKGYDFAHCRRALRQRAIIPWIARRSVESSERLGRYRWVVERTLAWVLLGALSRTSSAFPGQPPPRGVAIALIRSSVPCPARPTCRGSGQCGPPCRPAGAVRRP